MAKKKPTIEEQILTEENIETVTEVVKPTIEEQILGAKDEVKIKKVVDYTSRKRIYKIFNVLKNRTYTLDGLEIGAILGINEKARNELKEGAKKISICDAKGNELYKIEVVK